MITLTHANNILNKLLEEFFLVFVAERFLCSTVGALQQLLIKRLTDCQQLVSTSVTN